LELLVWPPAVIARIAFENSRAVGVRYRKRGMEEVARAKREVILSAGAIGSPHLLMASGVGPAEHLRDVGVQFVHDLPKVGLVVTGRHVRALRRAPTGVTSSALRRSLSA
jgi:choline dehydrogenase-like flavoprotein